MSALVKDYMTQKKEVVSPEDSVQSAIELMVDHAESRIPEIMLTACHSEVVIRSVGLHEPTLEDVFLKFTGKKIREAESANQGKMNAIRMWHRRK